MIIITRNIKTKTNLTKEHSKEPKQHKVLCSRASIILLSCAIYHNGVATTHEGHPHIGNRKPSFYQ